jgi:hypothetical protein
VQHRHLTHHRHTLTALDDLIENGTLADWRPVLARVRRDPHGQLAARLTSLLRSRDYGDNGVFWQVFIASARRRAEMPAGVSAEPARRSSNRRPVT